MLDAETEERARVLVDAGLKVHKALGPGLLESAYEHCLTHELQARGLRLRRQVQMPIVYDGVNLDAGYKLDLLVEETIVVEIKSVDALTRVHEAQFMTYLKLANLRLGFLMNFNTALFKDGIKRIVI